MANTHRNLLRAIGVLMLLVQLCAGSTDNEAGAETFSSSSDASISQQQGTSVNGQMEVLHEDARIFVYPDFLTPEECDHVIALAEPRLQRSQVVQTDSSGTGQAKKSNVRTSSGTFLDRGQDDVIKGIEERMARWTLLPVVNGESPQVLRYQEGEEYSTHWDYFFDNTSIANGGNRVATVLVYLNDVAEGGETIFPFIPAPGGANPADYSECAKRFLAVKPKRGTAVLFHSMSPNGQLEMRSGHASCPVMGNSVKYAMVKWLRASRYATKSEVVARVLAHVVAKQMQERGLQLPAIPQTGTAATEQA